MCLHFTYRELLYNAEHMHYTNNCSLQLFNNSKVRKYILSFLPTWLPLNVRVVNVLCFDIIVQCSWSWQIHNWNHHLLWSLLPIQGDSFYHSWPSFPKQQELGQFGHWQQYKDSNFSKNIYYEAKQTFQTYALWNYKRSRKLRQS